MPSDHASKALLATSARYAHELGQVKARYEERLDNMRELLREQSERVGELTAALDTVKEEIAKVGRMDAVGALMFKQILKTLEKERLNRDN